jgi:hypothetical protein
VPNVNTLLRDHVTLKCEMVDRMFLNGYVAKLQEPDQLFWFLCQHRGEEIPRYELLGKMTRDFVAAVEDYAAVHGVPLVQLEKGQRKEDVARPYFQKAEREGRYGVVMIGVSQEGANVFRAPAKGQREVGKFAAHRSSAYVKHFYVYIRDRDFGPSFIKFCTYAPFQVRVWLNGHQWLLERLRLSGHQVEALDNGIAWVDDPEALRRLSRRFSAAHIQRYFDRWMSYLPNPFSPHDRGAGYTYQLSFLQLEIADTRVFDRPLHGRQFFEEVIREHVDLGRPDQIQLVFGGGKKRSWRQPPRTRVFSEGIHPSLQVGYRNTRVKQYLKHGRALRTETTFHDTYDFGIGKKIENLPRLIERGRQINRSLLDLELQTQRPSAAASHFERIVMPSGEPGQRAPGLRLGDPRVVALYAVLARFALTVNGFRAGELQPLVEAYLGEPYPMSRMAYDLRRLRLNGLIQRLPRSHRYQLTAEGRRIIPFCSKLYSRAVCAGLRRMEANQPPMPLSLAARAYDLAIADHLVAARLSA